MIAPFPNAETWIRLLAGCTFKGSLVIALAFAASHALKRESAAVRHAVWAAAALGILALPLLTVMMPVWQPALPAILPAGWIGAPYAAAREAAPDLPSMAVNADRASHGWPGVAGVLFAVWAAGFAAGLAVLAAGALRLTLVASRATPLFVPRWMHLAVELSGLLGLRHPVRLLQNRKASMPVTWGFLRPRVLLPEGAERWPDERMRIVLAHELAHVRRRDWAVQILAEIARAVYWFNPLVWMGCDRLRQESEYACDDAVLRSGIDAPDYAGHLLDLARSLRSSERAWSVALAMARQSNLERRFVTMLNPTINRRELTRPKAVLAAVAAFCLMAPLAALRAPAQSVSGRFTGTVYDASGGVIPNATVIVTGAQGKTRDMTTTDAAGAFAFLALPAGKYGLEVVRRGFARFAETGVALPEGRDVFRSITLQLGKVTEEVEVAASSPAKAVRTAGDPGRTPQRLRVGGNVQQAHLTNMVRPPYPPDAKAAGVEGSVLLEAVIGKEGNLLSLHVMNSQVNPSLAKAAVEAVSQWRYQPTLLNGEPVEVITSIEVNFRLSE